MKTALRVTALLTAAFLLVPALFSLMGVKSHAAADSGITLGTDALTHSSVIDVLEENFNSPDHSWMVEGCDYSTLTVLDKEPYSSLEGRSLVLLADGYEAGTPLTVSGVPATLTSFDGIIYLALALYVPAKAGNVSVSLNADAGGKAVSSSVSAVTEGWQTVFFDVSGVEGTVSNISFTIKAGVSGNHRFVIDCIGGCRTASSVYKLKYFSDHYTPIGCTLTDGKELTVALTGEAEQYIEGQAAVKRLPVGTGILVKYSAEKGVKSMTLTYTSEGNTRKQTVLLNGGEGDAVFAIPDRAVNTLRISFDGTGEVVIGSVTLTSCYTPVPSIGDVTQTRISRDKRSISVKGSLDGGISEKYSSGRLQLYAVPFGHDVYDTTNVGELVAETEMTDRFAFNVRLDDSLDGIYKRYAVMIKHGTELIPVCTPKAVSNPSILSDSKTVFSESIKGSAVFTDSFVFDGIAQTTVFVYADTLMTLSDSGVAYECGGQTYYFSRSAVEELDGQIKKLKAEDVDVRFMLRLRTPTDLALKALLCHPRASGGEYSAFNTESDAGLKALRSIASFLVDRYGPDGSVTDNAVGIILGSDVNDSVNCYDLGGTGLWETVFSYTAAYRTVFNAARSRSSGFEVSVAVGGAWNGLQSASHKGSFGGRDFLRAFARAIADGGEVEWSLSCDITPMPGSYAYKQQSPDMKYTAERVTAANLEVLISFMEESEMTYNGLVRRISLTGTRINEASDSETVASMTADYVYTYLRALNLGSVTAYVPAHSYGEAVRYIDTAEYEAGCQSVINRIGKTRFDQLCASAEALVTRYFGGTDATDTLPDGVKGTLTLWSFDEGGEALLPSINCISAEGGVTYSGQGGLLRVRLDRIGAGAYGGVTSQYIPLDLSDAPYLSFDVRIASLPEGVDRATLSVAVYSGQSVHISRATVYSGRLNTVVCDLTSFPYLSSCDRVAIYVEGIDGQEYSDPTLLIGEINVHSLTLSDSELQASVLKPDDDRETVELKTVLSVLAAAVISILILAARLLYRRKKHKQTNISKIH